MTMVSKKKGDRAEHLLGALREAIIAGRFMPGQALRQEELAKEYESSRMPVREALRVLDAEGLVRLVPNKGAVVAPIDAAELQENTEMREAAELLALRLAIPQLSNAHIDEAGRLQDRIDSAGFGEFGKLNKAFHMTLYAPSARPRLLSHISSLHDVAERYIRFTLERLDYLERSSHEHRDLLAACYQRDTKAAEDILRQHILGAGGALIRFLGNHA